MAIDLNHIKVSVIVPCYNVEDCLDRSVISVLDQTHQNIELILIDNNSVDATWQMMSNYAGKHQYIKIDKETKKGPCPTRNKGLELATGQWIQFLDADDFIEPKKIAYQLSVAQEAGLLEKDAIVVGQKKWLREDGTVVQNTLSEDQWRDLIHGRLGDTCANLWSTSIIRKIEGWNEDLPSSTEVDLQFRALKNGANVVYDKKPLTLIYERSVGSISKADPVQNYARVIKQRLEIRHYINSTANLHQYLPFLDFFVFNNLKLLYFRDKRLFEEMLELVNRSGFDLTKNKDELSPTSRVLLKLFGIKGYLFILKMIGRNE